MIELGLLVRKGKQALIFVIKEDFNVRKNQTSVE